MHCSESVSNLSGVSSERVRSALERERSPRERDSGSWPVKVLPVHHPTSHELASYSLSPIARAAEEEDAFWGSKSWQRWVERMVPSIGWVRAYDWRLSLKADAIAGITVGTMLIPQVCY